MVCARFFRSDAGYTGFSVSGHAGYAEKGTDIVCASVSSAVQLTVNAITEIKQLPAKVEVADDTVRLILDRQEDISVVQPFLEALRLHLQLLAEDFAQYLKLSE